MPAFYSSVSEFQAAPIGIALTSFWQTLAPGVLDRMIMAASDEVDSFTKRKIGSPQYSYTLTANASAGAQSITVNWGTGIYPTDVVYFATTGEVVEVDSALITDFTTAPYPATIYLNTPLVNSYTTPLTFQVYRQDRFAITGKSTNAMDDLVAMSQAGQMARMHAPKGGQSGSSRKIFLKQYPLLSLKFAYHSLPWTSAETTADLSVGAGTYQSRDTATLTLPVGYFNPLGSHWRIQYFAGYHAVPQDIRDATNLYVAAQIARALNPIGAHIIRNEGQQAHMTLNSQASSSKTPPRSLFIEEAERKLARYRRKGR